MRRSSDVNESSTSMDALRASPALKGMDEGTLRELESVVEIASHDAGEVLLRQGDDADRLFVVLDGRLAIAVESDAAAPDQPLGEVGPGEIVGEVALLAGTRRTATVRALTPVRLGQVLRDEVRRLVASHPDLVEQLLVSSVRRLRRSQFAAYLARMFGTLDPHLLDDRHRHLDLHRPDRDAHRIRARRVPQQIDR